MGRLMSFDNLVVVMCSNVFGINILSFTLANYHMFHNVSVHQQF